MRLEKVSHLCTVILKCSNYGTRQESIQQQAKCVLHQPFNRQIKKMAQDGFPMAAATMVDRHQAVCGMIEPLYGGTLSDSVSLGDNRNPRLPR